MHRSLLHLSRQKLQRQPNEPAQTQPVVEDAGAHDDFDWSIDKRNVATYSKEEKAKYDAVYEGTFKAVTDGELVKGLVVALTKTDVGYQHRFQRLMVSFLSTNSVICPT